MKAIIPAFFLDGEVLKGQNGHEAVLRSARIAQAAQEIDEVYVVSDDPHLLDKAARKRLNTCLLIPQHEDLQAFPCGTQTILQSGRLQTQQSPLIFINFRNPLLTPEILHNAIRKQKLERKHVVVSAISCSDHPCQIKSPCNQLDSQRLVELSDDSRGNGRLTVPFSVNPKKMEELTTQKGEFQYYKYDENHAFGLIPKAELAAAERLRKSGGLENSRLIAVSVGNTDSAAGCYLFLDQDGTCHLAYRPLHPLPDRFEIILTLPSREEMRFPVNKQNRDVLWHTFDITRFEEKLPITFRVLSNDSDTDFFDYKVSWSPHGAPWRCSAFTNHAVNLETGYDIRGRQDFPAVLEPDGSFCIISGGFDLSLLRLPDQELEPYLLTADESLILRTSLDLMRYKVKQRLLKAADCLREVA